VTRQIFQVYQTKAASYEVSIFASAIASCLFALAPSDLADVDLGCPWFENHPRVAVE
jgi:hypothetical protein